MKMNRCVLIIFAFIQIVSCANCQQFLYIETKLDGCNNPLPMAYYVEICDSINSQDLLNNDSLLVDYLNKSQKIYVSTEVVYILRDTSITEKVENKFIADYEQYRNDYSFLRCENWDHFQVKIALVEHDSIKYSLLNWAHPKSVESYDYKNNAIHISIAKQRNFNYAYQIE